MLVSGGFVAVAHFPGLRAALYAGAGLMAVPTVTVAVGLLRA